jgi:2-dehydro-3-deoxyphosphogluconate aldolase/(4S)-4-hydroxy-2-oxoglutarate aldolase
MNQETMRNLIEEIGIIPAIRLARADDALFAVDALVAGGIPIAEVTMTIPGAIGVISELARREPAVMVGAGTVVNVAMARRCLDAGARFLSSPGLDLETMEFAVKEGVLMLPGALTPSEIMAASKAGADLIKIFPCSVLGGASYIRALKAPFPKMRFIASGGVNQQNTADFIRAGTVAVGVGRDLIYSEAIQKKESNWIHELARRYTQIVKDTRSEKSA